MARKNLNRGLGALAALGALSYHLSQGRGRTDGGAPVEDRSVRSRPKETFMGLDDTGAAEPRLQETFMGLDDVSGRYADTGGVGRAITGAATDLPAPAAAPAAAAAAAAAGPAPAPARSVTAPARSVTAPAAARSAPAAARSASAELASPDADFPSAGRTRAASSTEQGLTSQRAAPVGDRSAAPPLIRVLPPPLLPLTPLLFNAATARSAAPADAQAQKTAREAAAERRREARRVEPPDVGLNNPYYGRTGAQRTAALRAKGGAIKTKKMASGGMTSASKRGDGIASKGKTKCKMY